MTSCWPATVLVLVSLQTLVGETGKGEQEGFDILVHDGESGESKSVGLMSGGERVWVNECLIPGGGAVPRPAHGRRYGALFSDEADGPLDPERKRMFMAMKREVLRGWVSAGVFRIPDAGTHRHGGCGDQSEATRNRQSPGRV